MHLCRHSAWRAPRPRRHLRQSSLRMPRACMTAMWPSAPPALMRSATPQVPAAILSTALQGSIQPITSPATDTVLVTLVRQKWCNHRYRAKYACSRAHAAA